MSSVGIRVAGAALGVGCATYLAHTQLVTRVNGSHNDHLALLEEAESRTVAAAAAVRARVDVLERGVGAER